MTGLILKGGRVIDPANDFDCISDILIEKGKISKIGKDLSTPMPSCQVINCAELLVVPGLIDMHVHGRTPGQEHKENLGSLSLAAIMGGFTSLVCMANTSPAVDNLQTLAEVQLRADEVGLINLLQVSAVTKGLAGEEIIDLLAMKQSGAIAASDDGKGLQNPDILLDAMNKCQIFRLPLLLHCEDSRFSPYDRRSEIHQASLALKIAEEFGLPMHLQHVSCKETVQLVREAQDRQVPVTCETAPHYIALTASDFRRLGTNAKMNPPLRGESDRKEIIQGLVDGTIDVIATDHAPHAPAEKAQTVEKAPFGIIGLETLIPVVFTQLAHFLAPKVIIRKLTANPAKILGLNGHGALTLGSVADITVIDPKKRRKVDVDQFQSLSRNCPWAGKRLQGWPVMTIHKGKILMQDGELSI